MNIVNPKNFNKSDIQFSDVKPNNYGGKMVYINNKSSTFLIQTPEMFIPYGLGENEITDQKTGEVTGHKYHVNLSFKGIDNVGSSDPKVKKNQKKLKDFHKMIQDIDDIVLEQACGSKSLQWLKQKKCSKETAMALYSPMLIKSKDKETQEPDGKYPDTIKGKIQYWEGVFKTEIYNENKELVDLKASIVKGTEAKALLQCTGIWFAGGKFGVGWKLVQMKVKVPETLQGYSFVESDDDDEDGDGDGDDASNNIKASSVSESVSDSDSDDDICLENNKLNKGVNGDDDDDEDSD
jgi:hypothetical protein